MNYECLVVAKRTNKFNKQMKLATQEKVVQNL